MNKQQFTAALKEKCGKDMPLTNAGCNRIVDAVLDIISETVAAGDEVQFVGFGTFGTAERAARIGRNPQTGEAVNIPAKTVPVFHPGKAFKDAVGK